MQQIQLQPGEYFPISWNLDDPLDSTTYYVQAKVYDGKTNALLATLNLTDLGSGNFSKQYQVPADGSGLGRYIYIQKKVYTDSGYSSLAPTKAILTDTFLIQDRVTRGAFGGGGYTNIDYVGLSERISKIIDEKIAKIEDKVDKIKIKETDYDKIGSFHSDRTDYETIKILINEAISKIPQVKIPESITRAEVEEIFKLTDGKISENSKVLSKFYKAVDERIDSVVEKINERVSAENSMTKKWVKDHVEKYIDYLEGIIEQDLKSRYGDKISLNKPQ